jgi:hypothetical protein
MQPGGWLGGLGQKAQEALYTRADEWEAAGSRGGDNCFYDPTLITEPKTFHLQYIPILFGLKDSCHARR